MSTPILLTVLEANIDDHMENCISNAEDVAVASAAIVPIDAQSGGASSAIGQTGRIMGNSQCASIMREFRLKLHAPLQEQERIGLTGNAKVLGEWQLERSVPLEAKANILSWSAQVMMAACRQVQYRYFVYTVDSRGHKQIRRWESQFRPRTLSPCPGEDCVHEDSFGDIAIDTVSGRDETDQAANNPCLHRGWLTHEAIVQLKFEREHMYQVIDIDAFDPDGLLIKIEPLQSIDNEIQADTESSTAAASLHIEVARLVYGHSELKTQPEHGIEHRRGDVVIFHMTLPQPLATDFIIYFQRPDTYETVGRAIVRAEDLRGSAGELALKILGSTQQIVARLTLPYLVVLPLSEDLNVLDFQTTYAHFWPRSWPNLDIGHRGNGRSYIADAPVERENTIASFRQAHELLADMVEFDVHLTADGVPIIYHDFGVRTAPQGKKVTSADHLQYVLIKDLSYNALKQLRVFALIDGSPVEYPAHNAEPSRDRRIFPTLKEVLTELPLTLGMDVEIKWPQLRAGGNPEASQTIDKNFFVDKILTTVLEFGGGRALFFSSFDADLCTMLRFKQNRFPVIFLTMGETRKWSPFMDLRTRTFEQAINMAQAMELAGTAPHAEDFLDTEAAAKIKKAQNMGQITIIWGDDCNTPVRVEYFTSIGATATCYDRTDRNIRTGKERAFFNSEEMLAEFAQQNRE